MAIPHDYVERVYAGVLGKIIGVYLGRPFEGWTYERITQELGEVAYYVHERFNKPLIVTDDDVSGTFSFVRALADYGHPRDLTPGQIGQTWLNYIIERRTILWWGGLGNSTEHTAYLRLKVGVPAPRSGSAELNGQVVAEQIGSQIFIDGWGMVAPGDPELAADLARRAASVSHDGEAIYGAQVIAAMEAQAFIEADLEKLLDCAVSFIPKDSVIYRLISDLRRWRAEEPDWRRTRERIVEHYGYDRYGGNVHVVPNHAVVMLGLLYGDDDLQRSLMIANTAGWDTDCNSGNVGCVLGIKNGLAGIDDGPDWRGPVADRMYLPTADGGRCITDAATEAYHLVNAGRVLAGQEPVAPKNGARFHFELPRSVQGFAVERGADCASTVEVENVEGYCQEGSRSLAIHYRHVAPGQSARVSSPTFIPPEAKDTRGYGLLASPTLYSGQSVRARLCRGVSDHQPVSCRLYIRRYGADDRLVRSYGPQVVLRTGEAQDLVWRVPNTAGDPIAEVGLEISAERAASGTLYLDYLTWDGAPDVAFEHPRHNGTMWRRAWVDGVDQYEHWSWYPEPYRLMQNDGVGLLIQGTREWTDYTVMASLRPHMAERAGIAARVQGMRRYYALLLCADNRVHLVKALDGERMLAEAECAWELDRTFRLALSVCGAEIVARVDDEEVFRIEDSDRPLEGGAVALVADGGRVDVDEVAVRPVTLLT